MNKGYSSSRKANGSEVAFPTVEPIRTEQHGLSVLAHVFTREVGLDAAEAGSGTGLIEATAHVALKGDVIRMTSGASAEVESKVVRVEANLIYLADEVVVADTDTFQILRHKYAVVDDDGNLQVAVAPSPIFYERDGLDQVVIEDTGTPGDSRPLPVKVFDFAGAEVDFATEAKQDAANASLAAIEAVDFATETTLAALAAEDFATETTLDAVKTAVESIEAVDFATEVTLAALLTELQLKADLTETQPVSAASLPLPTGAAEEATLASLEAKDFATQTTLAALLTELQGKADLGETQPVSLASVPLPTGAATEATLAGLAAEDFASETTLAAASAKLPATLGQKTKANSLAVVLASDSDVLPVSDPGNDYADSARKGSGSVTSSAWVELIASTAAAAKGLCLFDSSGVSLELGIGAAASETRKLIVPPGGLNGFIPLAIPAGSRVSVRALNTTADYTDSELLLTLLG